MGRLRLIQLLSLDRLCRSAFSTVSFAYITYKMCQGSYITYELFLASAIYWYRRFCQCRHCPIDKKCKLIFFSVWQNNNFHSNAQLWYRPLQITTGKLLGHNWTLLTTGLYIWSIGYMNRPRMSLPVLFCIVEEVDQHQKVIQGHPIYIYRSICTDTFPVALWAITVKAASESR